MHTAAGEKVGYRRQQKSTWFDDECRQAAIDKNDAYQVILKSGATPAVYEKYREKRIEERHLFCRKKHEFVKVDCEEIEMHGGRNDAATPAVYEKYREKRREERHLFRRKQHEFVKAECEETEMHGSRKDARKFFQMIAVCCGVSGRALASHTGVRRFDSCGGDCLLLFADYKLRSIYKS